MPKKGIQTVLKNLAVLVQVMPDFLLKKRRNYARVYRN